MTRNWDCGMAKHQNRTADCMQPAKKYLNFNEQKREKKTHEHELKMRESY